jgi:uncharacterized membrane protein
VTSFFTRAGAPPPALPYADASPPGSAWPQALCVVATVLYAALALATHRSLGTNGFDLSVFDYALWTSATGGPLGYVPLFRHSLFSQHFMPTLLLLSPLSLVFSSPAYLLVLQAAVHGAAGWLLYRVAVRHLSPALSVALTAAFLFSRRSHSAIVTGFHIESLEPLLVFGLVLAWMERRLVWYWVLTLLALGVKEDMAVYLACFGLLQAFSPRDRSTGLATMTVSVAWLVLAFAVAIPHARAADLLPSANPFAAGRFGLTGNIAADLSTLTGRLLSFECAARAVTVISATAGLCLLSPRWFAIAVPGLLANLAAVPGSLQAGPVGHYLFPILPWLFVAAVMGAERLATRLPRWAPAAVALVALIEMPLPRALLRAPWVQPPEAARALDQLAEVAPLVLSGAVVAAQPNLVPHLPRTRVVHGLGVSSEGQPKGDLVLLTWTGDLWPFEREDIDRQVAALRANPGYAEVASGPVWVFRRR